MKTRVGILIVLLAMAMTGGPGAQAQTEDQRRAEAGTIVFEPGAEVRLTGGMNKIRNTSKSFRQAVRRELLTLWKTTGNAPACRRSPLVIVEEYRASGVAFVEEGVYGPAKCAGGGFSQFMVKRGKTWRSPNALAGQELPSCSTLVRYRIPRMSGAESCWADDGMTLVNHFLDGLPTIDWNADTVQAGETFCGTFYQGSQPQRIYASGLGCTSTGILTDWWLGGAEAQPGWTCEGFQNGLLGCATGDEYTIARSVVAPYYRAVKPGGLLEPTT